MISEASFRSLLSCNCKHTPTNAASSAINHPSVNHFVQSVDKTQLPTYPKSFHHFFLEALFSLILALLVNFKYLFISLSNSSYPSAATSTFSKSMFSNLALNLATEGRGVAKSLIQSGYSSRGRATGAALGVLGSLEGG